MHQDTSRPDRKGPAPKGPRQKTGGHTEPAKKGDGFPSNFLVGAMLAICFCSHSGKQKTTTSQNPKSVAPGFQRKMKPKQPGDKALSSKPHPFFFRCPLLVLLLDFCYSQDGPRPVVRGGNTRTRKTWNLGDSLARKKPPAHTTLPTLPRSWKRWNLSTHHTTATKITKKDAISWCLFW